MPHSPSPALTPQSLPQPYPASGSLQEKFRFLLHYAVFSPSGHNTQPWHFKIAEDRIELYADRTRALPAVDPQNRELIISCGAAFFHLRLAFRHFGYTCLTEILPDPDNPDFLAWIGFGKPEAPTSEEELRFQAIPDRHTYRFPFEPITVPTTLLQALQDAAEQEGANINYLQDADIRHTIAHLIAAGDHIQAADAQFRQELAAWIHPNYSSTHDGIPGYAFGYNTIASSLMPLLIKALDWGKTQAAKDQQLAIDSPVLAVLSTSQDTPTDWFAAGQALASVLLFACAQGVSAGFLNQPIEVPLLRSRLQEILQINAVIDSATNQEHHSLINGTGYPQLLLRMGYGSPVKATPRRQINEVVESF